MKNGSLWKETDDRDRTVKSYLPNNTTALISYNNINSINIMIEYPIASNKIIFIYCNNEHKITDVFIYRNRKMYEFWCVDLNNVINYSSFNAIQLKDRPKNLPNIVEFF